MTGTPTDASPECGHPANELLDFHVNGSLEGDEAAMVAAHVAACAACARDLRELQSLSEAIAAHGVAPASAWRGGSRLWIGLGTAAAVVVGIIFWAADGSQVFQLVRSGASESQVAALPPGNGAPAVVEDTLDLGSGTWRGAAAGPPRVKLAPGVSVLRLTLTHPAPGTKLRFGVRGPGDEETVTDEALPSHDAMGRVTIAVPVSRFTTSGNYEVVLKSVTPGSEAGLYTYPFEVRISSDRN